MTVLLLIVLFLSASCFNYIAYTHVKRYKYYKQVVNLSFEQCALGLLIGFPFIFMPFVISETDRGFIKYKKVKEVIFLARASATLLALVVAYLVISFLLIRWMR